MNDYKYKFQAQAKRKTLRIAWHNYTGNKDQKQSSVSMSGKKRPQFNYSNHLFQCQAPPNLHFMITFKIIQHCWKLLPKKRCTLTKVGDLKTTLHDFSIFWSYLYILNLLVGSLKVVIIWFFFHVWVYSKLSTPLFHKTSMTGRGST